MNNTILYLPLDCEIHWHHDSHQGPYIWRHEGVIDRIFSIAVDPTKKYEAEDICPHCQKKVRIRVIPRDITPSTLFKQRCCLFVPVLLLLFALAILFWLYIKRIEGRFFLLVFISVLSIIIILLIKEVIFPFRWKLKATVLPSGTHVICGGRVKGIYSQWGTRRTARWKDPATEIKQFWDEATKHRELFHS